MHLVDQAKMALSQGKPDAAIPLLEQAIQIDAYNGEAFFGLARAWRMKGSRNKAQEFAQKAELLLQDQPSELKEVYSFQADLFKELGKRGKWSSTGRRPRIFESSIFTESHWKLTSGALSPHRLHEGMTV